MDIVSARKNYSLITGLLFAVVACVHFLRVVAGWDITINGAVIPMWVSWVGLIVPAILAYYGLRFGQRQI